MDRIARFIFWCTVNTIWPLIQPLIKFCRIDFIFVVYPGSDADVKGYMPLWFRRVAQLVFPISLIGLITSGKNGRRGLVVALNEDPNASSKEELATRIERFAHGVRANWIALAGRLPSIFATHRISRNSFLTGERGTVFTLTESLSHLLHHKNIPKEISVGVVGVGFIGKRVLGRLEEIGYTSLIGVDTRFKNDREYRRGVILTRSYEKLSRCRVVIILTPRGLDIEEAIFYIQPGTIVIDDTHPQIPANLKGAIQKRGGEVYRACLELEGVRFIPALPTFQPTWLPGCVVEALVVSNGFTAENQDSFEKGAKAIGLRPILIQNKG